MIEQRSIDLTLESTDIVDVIGSYIELKKKGADYTACCPFHTEQTPSFMVSPAKQIYKCFGCGKAGNAVSFIQEKEGVNFPEAIRWLAKRYNITLEESGYAVDPQKADKEKEYRRVIKSIANQYRQQYIQLPEDSPAKKEIKRRQLTDDEIIEWQISYAPANWQFITNLCIQNAVWTPAEELHFVKKGLNGNHDQFHNRILFPIHDHNGQLVSFGAQALTEKDKKAAKYINGSEGPLYKKSNILFGLDKAKAHIQKANTAIIVEGYYDVIAMHRFAMNNTCGTCGTSLTAMHVKLLSRWAKRVVFIFDTDKGGLDAALRSVDLALEGGLHPAVCFFPEGEDPDSFARQLQGVDEGEENAIQKYIKQNQQDGVLWKAKHLINIAGEDVLEKAGAQNEICLLLAKVSDDFRRKEYIKNISKQLKFDAKAIERFVKGEIDRKHRDEEIDENDIALPQGVNRDDFLLHGFYGFVKGDDTGYFFAGNGRETTKLTNFVIEPLYHVYSKEDNKRIIRINNGREEKLLQMESKGFISLEQFKSRMFEEGFFVTYGGFNAVHLSKIVGKIGRQFPFCYELTTLGWQPEGFFAFSNAIYNVNEIQPFDERGIISHKGVNYFSPSASKITEGERGDSNPYENDLFLTYQPTNKSFNDWAVLMQEAFDEKSMLATAFVFVTLFRDLVFKMENTCPMLYAYGQVQSGKSAFGQRISNLFFKDLLPFNLNQGTDFAFHNRLGRFRNCPAVYNEFDETAIKEEWFRALKAVYDGEGRERGKMGAKNKTEVQKPNSTVILLGQVLSTKDDGSVLSRCIIVEFKNVEKRPDAQIKAFNTLIEWEKQGISGLLLQVLQHRPLVEKNLPENYGSIKKQLRNDITAMGRKFKDRIVNNYAVLLALVKILGPVLKLPFSFEYFYKYSVAEIIRLTSLITDTNALAGFWKTVEFLLDTGKAAEGWDFIIETAMNVEIKVDGDKKLITFDVPTKLLFLRIDNLHSQYLILHRQQNGGVGINKASLLLYISQEKYYIGNNPSKRFTYVDEKGNKKSSPTSSYVLLYDEIGVNLERFEFEGNDAPPETGFKAPAQTGIDFNKLPIVKHIADDDLPF